MWNSASDEASDGIYLAGEYVQPGLYRRIGGKLEVKLARPDYLPASLDGRVACYTRVHLLRRDGASSARQAA
jgi:hypothetical protein